MSQSTIVKAQILCINKDDRLDPHQRITHIGGRNADGKAWRVTQRDAIDGIKAGRWQFYVTVNGRTVNVIVAVSRFGHEYIKTEADGETPNNLLSLPECS